MLGPNEVMIGDTIVYTIDGTLCTGVDSCNYSLTSSFSNVFIVNADSIDCGNQFKVAFDSCGVFTLDALRPCDGFTIGSFSVRVRDIPPSPVGVFDTICENDSTILSSSCAAGDLFWYDDTITPNLLFLGDNYQTPTLDTTTTFYARCETNCDSSFYTPFKVTIREAPSQPNFLQASDSIECVPFNTVLSGTVDAGIIRWFSNSVDTGIGIANVQTITSDTRFYAKAYLESNPEGCRYSVEADSILLIAKYPIYDTIYDTTCQGKVVSHGIFNATNSGIYNDTLVADNGCDSIVTLILHVTPPPRDTIYASICFGSTYSFGGMNYGATGNYFDTTLTAEGCDSITMLDLFVRPLIQRILFVGTCEGIPYDFNGKQLDSSGVYSDTLVTPAGCDSAITVSLDVFPIERNTIDSTVCAGKNVVFGGNPRDTAGQYYDTTFDIFGCMIITELDLSITDPPTFNENATICSGQSFMWNGNSLIASGVYYDTTVKPDGCDSITILTLTVTDTIRDTLDVNICLGTSYSFGGNLLDSAGFYSDTLVSPEGCDSISILNLTIDPIIRDTANVFTCLGTSFSFGGNNVDTTGYYSDTLVSPAGCDSISVIYLTIEPIIRDTFDVNICLGTSYSFAGQNLNSTGYYSDTLVSPAGCDSISILSLVIDPIIRDTFNVNICLGTSYSFAGQNLDSTGRYSDTLVSPAGCDSISILSLVIDPIIRDTFDVNICLGTSYSFAGQNLDSTGHYSDTLVSPAGCDSISILSLTIDPIIRDTFNVNICLGTSYSFAGQNLDSTGHYSDTLVSPAGCDSISILSLVIDPIIRDTFDVNICLGTSYSFAGQNLDSTGHYSDTLVSSAGCDSISVLNLVIDPIIRDSISETICFGSTYNFGGDLLNAPGIYNDTLTTSIGCDSISVIDLSVDPIIRDSIIDTICFGTTYSFGVNSLDASGVYNDTLKTTVNCDSISTISLYVTPIIRDTFQREICFGSFFPFGMDSLDQSGVYSDTLQNAEGCDSISTVELSIAAVLRDSIIDTICFGSYYLFGTDSLVQSGVYNDTLKTALNCDSISTISLHVNGVLRDTIYDTTCVGFPVTIGNITTNTSGIYNDSVVNADGCDSIISVVLYVTPILRDTIYDSICKGTYYYLSIDSVNQSGIYDDTIKNSAGCDSITTIHLFVKPILRDTLIDFVCETYQYNFNGRIFLEDTIVSDTLKNSQGCDSIIVLELTQVESKRDTINEEICQFESYLFAGQYFFQTGFYSDTLVSPSTSCDSIITLSLQVNPTQTIYLYDTICETNYYLFGGDSLTLSGIYTDSLVNSLGCDSITVLNLNVTSTEEFSFTESICDGDTLFYGGIEIFESGVYYDTVNASSGCLLINTLIIQKLPLPLLFLEGDTSTCEGENASLSVTTSGSLVTWNTGDTTNFIEVDSQGMYIAYALDDLGCVASDSMYVRVDTCNSDTCHIFAPNSFTPNGDGVNDFFYLGASDGCSFIDYRLRIFDRWGEVIFETNDETELWDGKKDGVICKSEAYIYLITYKKAGSVEDKRVHGVLQLIR